MSLTESNGDDGYIDIQMPEPFKKVIDFNNPQDGLWVPNVDSYMVDWPDIEEPESMVIICNQWEEERFFSDYGWESLGWTTCPSMLLTMPNGATLEVIYNDPIESSMDEENFLGDWDVYLSTSTITNVEKLKGYIIDVVNNAYDNQEDELRELEL